jgi:uncharacterized repeat protein (TIGR03803 family)
MLPKNLLMTSLAVAAVLLLAPGAYAAHNERVLYSFHGGSDGSYPTAGLISDKAGNLYGTTSAGGSGSCSSPEGFGCGTVFELSPLAGGGWTEKEIYTFQGSEDGAYPNADLTLDTAGNLYGSTTYGGSTVCSSAEPGCGVIFELSPGNPWTEKVLYRFQGGNDGAYPSALVFDHSGNIYGGASGAGQSNCGTIFELTPSGQSWSENTLYTFAGGTDGCGPAGSVIFKAVSIYGTTSVGGAFGHGAVFRVGQVSGGRWTENLLYSFGLNDGHIPNGVISDKAGDLFGTNFNGGHYGYGSVFEVSASDNESLIFNFGGSGLNGQTPRAGLTFDAAGNLYGTTQYGGGAHGAGVVFKLAPNTSGGWTATDLYSFTGGSDGGQPFGNILVTPGGHIYGTTWVGGSGTCTSTGGNGCGVVFEIQ